MKLNRCPVDKTAQAEYTDVLLGLNNFHNKLVDRGLCVTLNRNSYGSVSSVLVEYQGSGPVARVYSPYGNGDYPTFNGRMFRGSKQKKLQDALQKLLASKPISSKIRSESKHAEWGMPPLFFYGAPLEPAPHLAISAAAFVEGAAECDDDDALWGEED